MKLSTKTLGVLGMIGAPFLFLEMYTNMRLKTFNTSLTGVFDLTYMLGWMCSIVALIRMQATGMKKGSVAILYIQLAFLSLANIANIWVIIHPTSTSMVYRVLDFFWPLSNVWMLVVGIAVLRRAKLQGWRRYIVLVVGLWLPLIMASSMVLGKEVDLFYACGTYSAIAWALLGWAIVSNDEEEQPLVLAI